ncbi:hypothetical protein SLA2020_441900 [Shorea laevis]
MVAIAVMACQSFLLARDLQPASLQNSTKAQPELVPPQKQLRRKQIRREYGRHIKLGKEKKPRAKQEKTGDK